ncbi:LysR family transcriptional regulator [Roseibium alexandrii]|uniref:Transcriptional regulator n=1 Tax=Roseibium alexandrii (strain DSM 17067 / NCIMB 14079 / DFL-11) TaxID=244592 RepID=A0A5E8GZM6_ROSAD|nr:LysR family transcriptional regulator [Roseibium alexandrii]EEE45085.1 Transcriptional regulator [Roseibium alexandrii DFL-11]
MDKLSALSSFVNAVRLGSFSAAATHLGVSQPAVSQQVRSLEDTLGTRLINRTTRRLSLTEAGERYFAYASDILEKLSEADRSVQSNEAQMSGRLTVSLPYAFTEPELAGFLTKFKAAYPNILFDVQLSDAMVDLQKERIDVAIRMGHLRDDRLIVKKLGDMKRCLVASPDYLNRRGRPETPENLKTHDFLLYPHIAEAGSIELVGPTGKAAKVAVSPTMVINNSAALRRAAIAGLGISTAVTWLSAPHFGTGELELILEDWSYGVHPIHAVYPSYRFIPMKVRQFVSDLQAHLDGQQAFADPTAHLAAAE